MGLRAKIFIAFLGILAVLVGFTLYVTNTQTTAFERARISEELRAVQARFEDKFKTERAHTLKLVATITSDQKYRSFLQQVRDNFFSFAEEVAIDTGADLVSIFDEDLKLRGISPDKEGARISKERLAWIKRAAALPHITDTFEGVLEDGHQRALVQSMQGKLLNMVHVPLKESLTDDYALGVVSVGHEIDNGWVKSLISGAGAEVQVIFHMDKNPVASNLTKGAGGNILAAALGQASEVGGFTLDGERFIMLRGVFEQAGWPAGYIFAASLDKAMAPFVAMQWNIVYTAAAALLAGIFVILFITNKIVFPIRLLVDGTRRVMTGDYDFQLEKHTDDEVGELSEAFSHMVDGLKEKEQIRSLFGKYVHPSIVSDIMENPENLERGGTRKVQTLLFSDIAGFTTISEGMDAEALVSFLNEYMGAMADQIAAAEGIVDKYLGDGIMAFWGPPFTKDNHALSACRAALGMQRRLAELRAQWKQQGRPEIGMRIGLATGDVIVGNIGSEQSQDYTCIGDTVNLSSRLEGVNKLYGTGVIIDHATREMAGDLLVTRELDTVQVKGREEGTRIFELVGLNGEVADRDCDQFRTYENGLALYRAGEFARARAIFESAGLADDPASKCMLAQCQEFEVNPPAEWNGVRALDVK
ncbi:MAG: adenylate/guanylate cyclase domain-containing protein [Rhodospirillales bacterium]|jgi:adenylate cyclase|nr:adenylate/guanylate cyclase domain-containing protein [Rhodospirillales bacterium]